MKVSIITSCYNRELTIRRAIESVLSQDYPNIEYIIVDGASKDNSLNIIQEYKNKICKIICEPDHGMYEAINKGIRIATGDIIGLVHSDDFLYSPHTITHIVNKLIETKADFLYGDGLFVNEKKEEKIARNWISGNYRLWKLKHGWLPLHPTCYIRREVMINRELYNESYKIAADSDLLFRYLVRGDLSVVYLKEYIIKMRMGGLSTNKARRKQMWLEDIRMYNSHGVSPIITKIEKILWKIPQYIRAKLSKQ